MRLRELVLLPALAGLLTPAADAATAYAIGDGGLSLLRFDTTSPGTVSQVGLFGGDAAGLDSIDFRPSSGQLFGYLDSEDAYYVVNTSDASLTKVSASPVGATTNTFFLGMDWNPTIDRLRVVTDSTQNIVYNPNTGTAAAFTALFYAAGDVNEGIVPLVIENAYTNNIAGLGMGTQQYVLDYDLNVLATLGNNAGTLNTVGEVTLDGAVLDFDEYTGFDIFTPGAGTNIAYALLRVGGVSGLYTIDLATGAATSLGAVDPSFGLTYGLAVVPEPASVVLMAVAGAIGLFATIRRRRLA